MEFWRGNRIDAQFEMPVAEVARQFMEWENQQPEAERGLPERELRCWLTSPVHFNSVWVDKKGEEGFGELLDAVLDLMFPATETKQNRSSKRGGTYEVGVAKFEDETGWHLSQLAGVTDGWPDRTVRGWQTLEQVQEIYRQVDAWRPR
jgi:hypothetical protein